MRRVPREAFLPPDLAEFAYEDTPLPIEEGQTISQPYIVALMTQVLELEGHERVLEIGTGSGFQTALLAQFSRRVYTIERVKELSDTSRKRLRDMGYVNVIFKQGDGSIGWPQHGPFNKIIVTAGAPVIPETLLQQLAVGGRMVIPTGNRDRQDLVLYHKTEQGLEKSIAAQVVFVPLIGNQGWKN